MRWIAVSVFSFLHSFLDLPGDIQLLLFVHHFDQFFDHALQLGHFCLDLGHIGKVNHAPAVGVINLLCR
jgi:hypothetical protein